MHGVFDDDAQKLRFESRPETVFHLMQLTSKLPDGTLPRAGHTLTAITLGLGLIEVTVFGGCPIFKPSICDHELRKFAETTVMTFGKKINNDSHARLS